MAGPDVVQRPGGRPYRARGLPRAVFWSDDWDFREGVLVLRTHDRERAARLAHRAFARWSETPDPFPAPVPLWVRHVPWGGNGDGCYEDVPPTTRGAVPAVGFTVDYR